MPAWRVFPWYPSAALAATFSPQYVHPSQGSGRFDLAAGGRGLLGLYPGESPAHAIGAVMQAFRRRTVGDAHPCRYGHGLPLLEVHLDEDAARLGMADLTRSAVLEQLDVRPDVLARHDRRRTRAAARGVHAAG